MEAYDWQARIRRHRTWLTEEARLVREQLRIAVFFAPKTHEGRQGRDEMIARYKALLAFMNEAILNLDDPMEEENEKTP